MARAGMNPEKIGVKLVVEGSGAFFTALAKATQAENKAAAAAELLAKKITIAGAKTTLALGKIAAAAVVEEQKFTASQDKIALSLAKTANAAALEAQKFALSQDKMALATQKLAAAQTAFAAKQAVQAQAASGGGAKSLISILGKLGTAYSYSGAAGARLVGVLARTGLAFAKVAPEVALVVAGLGLLVAPIALAVAGAIKLTKWMIALARAVGGALLTGLKKIWDVIAGIGRALAQAAIDAAKFVLKTYLIGSAVAVFAALWSIIKKVGEGIKELTAEAFKGAVAFQVLTIRLEGLLARQARNEDANISVAESYRIAGTEAQRYLNWIRQLAVTSPFTVSEIAKVFSLANAYGFTAEEAKRLTVAVGNFTAGMGLTGEEMQRIVENFGQMRAAGKVTGTELRDLARGAFVPVNDILEEMAKNLGVAEEDLAAFKQTAREGGVDVNEFFRAFEIVAERDFPGAMERMSRTWEGVTSNVKDFIQTVIGIDVLGPLVSRMAEHAADGLDFLLSPAVTNAAKLLGEALVVAFDRVWAAAERMSEAAKNLFAALGFGTPTVEDLIGVISLLTRWLTRSMDALTDWANSAAQNIGGTLRSIATAALQWGINISVQLAQGLINGAASAIVAAMNYISQLLSKWLSPGSPPLVAPNIDIWGGQAFLEWLKGFTSQDFDILNSIQNPLQSALSALVSMGKMGGGAASKLFSSISLQISELLANYAGGGVPGELMSTLTNGLGAYGAQIGILLQKQLALLDAVKALEAAEKMLAAAREAEEGAIAKVGGLTAEYNALLRAGASPEVLAAKLKEINAAEEQRALAIEQRKAAEIAVEDAEARVDPLKEQVDLQEKLLQQLLGMQSATAGFLASLASAADIDVPNWGWGGGKDDDGKKVVNKTIELKWKKEKTPSMFDALGDQLEESMRAIFDGFETQITEGWLEVKATWDTAMASIFGREKQGSKTGESNSPFAAFAESVSKAWKEIVYWTTWGWTLISMLWNTISAYLKPKFEDLSKALDELGIDFGGIAAVFMLAVFAVAIGFAIVVGIITDFVTAIVTKYNRIKAASTALWLFFTAPDSPIRKIMADLLTIFTDGLELVMGVIWKNEDSWVALTLARMLLLVTDFYDLGGDIMQGLLDGFKYVWDEILWPWFEAHLAKIPQWIIDLFNVSSPSKLMFDLGANVMAGFRDGMASMIPEIEGLTVGMGSMVIAGSQAAAAPVAAAPVSAPAVMGGGNTVNVSIGSINNSMNAAQFRNLLDRSLRRMN